MKYKLEEALQVLEKTPTVLTALLNGLSDCWIMNNEGPETFSPFDVLGHLIHGEKTDWPGRIAKIIAQEDSKTFVTYERFAMFEESKGKTIQQLLNEFEMLRKKNIAWLLSLNLAESDFDKTGIHPKFGKVTLRQLLATWVIHDLTHISQVTRVMAKQYKEEMGPWVEYFRLMSY